MFLRRLSIVAACYLVLIPAVELLADVFDTTNRTVLDVRVYPDGSFVFRFSPGFPAGTGPGCQYNDHTLTPPTAPAYKLISSLALTAYTSHRQVILIYNGCSGPGTSGNVNVTGLILPQQ